MPHPSWDDPAEFLVLGEFAVKAVIQFQGGTTREIQGMYDGPYREAALGEYEQDTTRPRFTVLEGAANLAKRGDGLVVYQPDGVTVFGTFAIMTHPQPDGTGMDVLELEPE